MADALGAAIELGDHAMYVPDDAPTSIDDIVHGRYSGPADFGQKFVLVMAELPDNRYRVVVSPSYERIEVPGASLVRTGRTLADDMDDDEVEEREAVAQHRAETRHRR